MHSFQSKVKAITADTMMSGFQKVMRDRSQAVLIATGKIGSVEVKEGVSVMVYGTENNWTAQAAVMVNGRVRLIAEAKFDNADI